MHKYLRYGILENLDTVRRIPAGKFWDIPIAVTPITWLGPFLFFGLRMLQNMLGTGMSIRASLADAVIFVTAVIITTLLHAFGHILGGKLAKSPMDMLLLTATRGVNLYQGDQSLVPGRVHVLRASGGPVLNLFVAGILFALLPQLGAGYALHLFGSLAAINLFFGAGGLLPLPSVDGQVIWREALRWLRAASRPRTRP